MPEKKLNSLFEEFEESGGRQELQLLMEKVYRQRGFDFREYKETTLIRRLGRRLQARGVKTYAAYSEVLDRDSAEYDKLFNDLTINVTSFFRDEVAFNALQKTALPAIISRNADTKKSLRIWSAGCASGEEPYSIAMLLLEIIGSEISQWDLTVIGTDINSKALEAARHGTYALKGIDGVQPTWLTKYFVPINMNRNRGFQVQPALRQLATFELHNLVSDPPYGDMDLVVCRNVLIYFEPALQTRVLKEFYESLKEESFLLLGKSEMPMGETKTLFNCIDTKAKLFQKARVNYPFLTEGVSES